MIEQDIPSQEITPIPYAGGLVRMVSLQQMQQEERRNAEIENSKPVIRSLASYVRQCWTAAEMAKRQTVQERMLKSVRQRRGEYDPEILEAIRAEGGSEIYMMLTSNKCRGASSWLKDVLLGQKNEKAWTLTPTPLPDLPQSVQIAIQRSAMQEIAQFEQITGMVTGPMDQQKVMEFVRDRVIADAKSRAKDATRRAEDKMEDQLIEGGFYQAMDAFIDDLTTFPTAVIKGPVIRRKPRLSWVTGANGQTEAQVSDETCMEWERIDPFNLYPSPASSAVNDGYLIERHKLTRVNLNELIGVEGYNDGAIRSVLDEYGRGGLHDWLYVDTAKASAEGKSLTAVMSNPESTIDALQFWGHIQGKMLIEWGIDEAEIPDPLKDYACEVWLIGSWVIKASLNFDPLGRKPYYAASYEEIPGSFWGNSVADLIRDCQTQCNAAARAIANNMGLASGPQMQVNIDRLPAGEDVTQIHPYRIWQTTSDPYGSSAKPIDFFAVPSIAGELMQVYQFFAVQADEQSGVPRYMTGDSATGGAGRTASGMSMLMGNASKAIKQVVGNIDSRILTPLLERLYFYNMKYGEDPELKGDVKIVARGANSLTVKEQAQVRFNEFLNMALSNPIVNQIVGPVAISEMLRQVARQLDLDVDKIVPPPEVIRAQMYQQQMAALQQQQAAMGIPQQVVKFERGPDGSSQGANIMAGNGQSLQNGAPVTDNFQPMKQ